MKKYLSLLLAMLMLLAPCGAQASWLFGDWGSYDDSYYDDSSSDGLGGLLDIFLGEGSSWTDDSYNSYDSYGSSGDSWGDLFGLFGDESYGSYDSYGSYGDDWGSLLDIFGGSTYDTGDDWSSFFGDSWDSDAYSSWGQSSYGDVSSLFDFSGLLSGGGTWEATDNGDTADWAATGKKNTTWAFYWYLCGSDLETRGGYATSDLAEMMKVKLPDNVTVVIQTGGSRRWKNNYVKNDRLQRWVYQGGEMKLVDEEQNASMGNPRTLAEFLDFCNRNFPADNRSVMFWNHGGGSVAGVAFDENYSYDALTLSEMHTAFDAVFEKDEDDPPLAMIGFDACLMATIDVAHTFRGFADYLVASEETEPGTGWDYQAWLSQLGANPAMSPARLGRIICDTYAKGCEASGSQGKVTLSVTDLNRVGELVDAYEAFGVEALQAATKDGSFFNRFARAAAKSENYGANSREQGYTNMVDLGHLARLTEDLLPSASAVTEALEDCVLYRVNGSYRAEATGLSCYYSFNGNVNELNQYIVQGVGDAFANYSLYGLSGQLTAQGQQYLLEAAQTAAPKPTAAPQAANVYTLPETNWDGMALTIDEDGVSCLELGPQADNVLSSIAFHLYLIDEDADQMLWLGSDNDIIADWEKGIFQDNFRGVWGSLNGKLVFMELAFEGEDYNLYSVPILLNGEECHLQVAYDFVEEKWDVLGARTGLEEGGMAAKDVRLIRKGDVITTLWYATSWSGDDVDFTVMEKDTITIRNSLTFKESPLDDAIYAMMYELRDAQGNVAYTEAVLFQCEDGEIYTFTY